MAVNDEIFAATTDAAKEAFAIENLVFSVQMSLQTAMRKQGVGHKELAERLGMSPARVSQIFSDSGPNLTLKTIARIQHALGREFVFVEKNEVQKVAKNFPSKVDAKPALVSLRLAKPRVWLTEMASAGWEENIADAA